MAYSNTRQRSDDKVTFDLMENLVVFGRRRDSDWTKEANIVSWNGGAPKLDIREWAPDHDRMSKGITLYEDEAERLAKALGKRYGLRAVSGEEERPPRKGGGYERFTDEDDCIGSELPFEETCAAPQETGDADENAMIEEAEEGGTS